MEKQVLCELELNRQKNIADNKAVLAQILKDLDLVGAQAVNGVKKESRQQKIKERKTVGKPRCDYTARRPVTRSCSSGISKENHNASNISEQRLVVKMFGKRERLSSGEEASDKERPKHKRPRVVVERTIVPVDEITDVELDAVSDNCKNKVYDQVNGTTCHQCRQKTIDQKTVCRSEECYGVRGQFCGVCLRNRYGEDAREALKDPAWNCPPCRGICNCSICRKHKGIRATGILIHIANAKGFTNVNDYLQSLQQ